MEQAVAELREWLRLREIPVETFKKRYDSYISNVGREGWEWLRAL